LITQKHIISKDSLKEIFDSYYKMLVLFAKRFLSSIGESEDLVQDVFIDLWEKNNEFPNEISLKIFMYKVVRNKCYNILKHNKVKNIYAENAIQSIEDDNLFLKQILENETVKQLYDAIEILPNRKKEIIKLSLKGMKNNEIAEELDIKLQTVKTLKSQSYKILREKLRGIDTIIYFLLN
jgi:RNA polymerase sigma-70 factor (family 1)